MLRRPPGSTRPDTLLPDTPRFRSFLQCGVVVHAAVGDRTGRGAALGKDPAGAGQLPHHRAPGVRGQRGREMLFHAQQWRFLVRSEEHTSELQSLMRISYAVFCLKKKKPRSQTIKLHRESHEE